MHGFITLGENKPAKNIEKRLFDFSRPLHGKNL